MTATPPPRHLPERLPEPGELVQVRTPHWLVEEVTPPPVPGESARVRLACADDTGLGKTIEAGLVARELLLLDDMVLTAFFVQALVFLSLAGCGLRRDPRAALGAQHPTRCRGGARRHGDDSTEEAASLVAPSVVARPACFTRSRGAPALGGA